LAVSTLLLFFAVGLSLEPEKMPQKALVNFIKRWWSPPTFEALTAAIAAPEQVRPPLTGKTPLALIFLFRTLPKLSKATLYQGLSDSGTLSETLQIFDEVLTPESGQYARLRFDGHQFRWHGVGCTAPHESVHQPIECSHWPTKTKAPMRAHQAHVICWYEGSSPDPSEQMIAMLRLACAFANQGLLGWVDTEAWNCMPTSVITMSLQPQALAASRSHVPVALWTGFIKLTKSENAVWFCTKGFHRWGLPDFACLGQDGEAEHIASLFASLFHYLRQTNSVLQAGDTAQFQGQKLRLGEVQEFDRYLDSPLGTLVVERT
jgi:hypothetical protein